MGKDTVTLALNGEDIKVDQFAKAVKAWSAMLDGLRPKTTKKDEVSWYVESLSMGSAITTARCIGDAQAVANMVDSYESAGRSYRQHNNSGISQKVDKAFSEIASLINGNIHSVRFETQDVDVELFSSPSSQEDIEEAAEVSASTVQGRIETIARHQGLRFTVYELHSDRPISCYLLPGKDEEMREAWGRMAIVAGLARRDPKTGRITTLRKVSEVEIIPEVTPQECLEVVGVYTPVVDEPPEITIRRSRDAENN